MKTLKITAAALTLCLLAGSPPASAQAGRAADHWVGTWATAVVARPQEVPQGPPAPGAPILNFNRQTLRQIVHTSLGGDRVRVVLSNVFGTAPLPVGAANVALRQKDATIVPASARPLTFGGSPSTTIAAGAIAISDPVSVAVPAFADLAIDIFLPGDTAASPSPLTTHSGAMQTSYVSAPGNHSGTADLPVASTMQSWFFLARVEVMAPETVGAVVAFGDSITDGFLSTADTNNRWPDHLARRLMAQATSARGGQAAQTVMPGVLNVGISGNRVLTEGIGPSALARFDREALVQSGVTHVIILEGINDFGMGGPGGMGGGPLPSAADVIAGLRQLIERAHTRGLKVIGGTLLPFEGTTFPSYYSTDKDARRQAVNEWIRTGRAYDGVIDFDMALRDPAHPLQVLPQYKAVDNLHLNDAGYQAMANAVNLAFLRR
jgi:lysophospholipase L1-like esterase